MSKLIYIYIYKKYSYKIIRLDENSNIKEKAFNNEEGENLKGTNSGVYNLKSDISISLHQGNFYTSFKIFCFNIYNNNNKIYR